MGPRNSHLFTRTNLNAAQILFDAMEKHDLHMTLPAYLPTLQALSTGNLTRTNNVFTTTNLKQNVTTCNTLPEERPTKSDHFPIDTEIALMVKTTNKEPKRNFRNVDWKEFQIKIKEKLSTNTPRTILTSEQEFYRKLGELTTAILETIEVIVLFRQPSPYMKRWWTPELSGLRSKARKASRKAYKDRDDRNSQMHELYQKARNTYANVIDKSKREHWDNFLESVDHKSMWTVNRYATGEHTDSGHTRIPTLKTKGQNGTVHMASTNDSKAEMLFNNFFPSTHMTEETAEEEPEYRDPAFSYIPISDEQIKRAIRRTNPFKAPGPNGIPNGGCSD